MFALSADMVLPRLSAGFQVKKTMTTVFFMATRLIVLNSLPQGQSFTQDYFISEIVPMFTKEKLRFRHYPPLSGNTLQVTLDKHNAISAQSSTQTRKVSPEATVFAVMELCGNRSIERNVI
jgi:hypothetical protein